MAQQHATESLSLNTHGICLVHMPHRYRQVVLNGCIVMFVCLQIDVVPKEEQRPEEGGGGGPGGTSSGGDLNSFNPFPGMDPSQMMNMQQQQQQQGYRQFQP